MNILQRESTNDSTSDQFGPSACRVSRLLRSSFLTFSFILVSFWIISSLSVVQAATYQWSNNNESGAGSLVQAIHDSNANPGMDTIQTTKSVAEEYDFNSAGIEMPGQTETVNWEVTDL